MLEIQKYLTSKAELFGNVGAFSALTQEYGISAKDYPDAGIVLLDYSQIDSPKQHPLTIECRSLILDRNTFAVVSRSFDRFFNYGECPEFYSDFSFSSSFIFEKADGSLIKTYWCAGTNQWEISTRGTAFAEGPHTMGGTFRERVVKAFGVDAEAALQSLLKNVKQNVTLIWEFTSPDNRIVTPYEKDEMVLLGLRVNDTGEFLGVERMVAMVEFFKNAGCTVRMPRIYDANSLDELHEAAKVLQNLEEGYVVWDTVSGKRTKIKSPTYLVAHKMRGENGLTPKNIYTLLFEGEVDEYLAYFPADKPHFDAASAKVHALELAMDAVWQDVYQIETQKDFALKVKDLEFSGVMFEARKKGVHPGVAFHQLDLNKKLRLMGL